MRSEKTNTFDFCSKFLFSLSIPVNSLLVQVHLDEENGFCCVDFVDEKDHTTVELVCKFKMIVIFGSLENNSSPSSSLFFLIPILQFDGIGYTAGDHAMEKDEVWSDGSRIFISRGETFDSLVSSDCVVVF
jgi:hypothetical protein